MVDGGGGGGGWFWVRWGRGPRGALRLKTRQRGGGDERGKRGNDFVIIVVVLGVGIHGLIR